MTPESFVATKLVAFRDRAAEHVFGPCAIGDGIAVIDGPIQAARAHPQVAAIFRDPERRRDGGGRGEP